MSWIRLDDGYLEHPKFRRLMKLGGVNALYLWHGALAWCAQHLTDGVIPGDMLDEPRGPTRPSARDRAWDALVQSGLCTRAAQEQHPGGGGAARVQHVLHDYTHYQPSASSVRAAREDAARRKQLSRDRKLHAESQCDADSNDQDHSTPVTAPHAPDPDPDPQPHPVPAPEGEETSPAPVRRLVWFVPNDWRPTELHRVRCQELRLDIEALVRDFRLQEFNRQYSDWDRRFSKWIEDEKLKRETAAVARVQGHRGAGPGGLGMAAKQHNPGLTGFESLKETV